jgi:hypothetical protein
LASLWSRSGVIYGVAFGTVKKCGIPVRRPKGLHFPIRWLHTA